jgi:hypothetical protein
LTLRQSGNKETKHMKRSTIVSSVAACFCLGLTAPALAAETPQADVPVWRQQQIAAAQPVTSKNTPFRPGELLGTEVRSPQNEALGSIENLVMSPATDKVAYLVIALDRSFGIDGISVPVPLEDFKITPNADLMVLDTTRGILEAPRG